MWLPLLRLSLALDPSIWRDVGQVQHLHAQFEQVQTRRILKTPLRSTGELDFQRPDALTWAVTAPMKSSFTLKSGVATMDQPDVGVHQVVDLAQVPDADRIAKSMMVWLQADPDAVVRDFDVAYGADDATLKPKDARLAGLIAAIHITFAPSPWRVAAVTLTEPDGDRSDIRFHAVVADGKALPEVR